MNINDVIKLIFLFTKKYYRINCFKKFNSISEEFEYIPKKICLSLSKLLTILGVLFSYIIPIIVLFSSDFFKYVYILITFIIYLSKIKKIKIINIREFVNVTFKKNAFFELYGIIIQTIYLLISMDIYIFLFISIIFILKFVNINIIKNIGIYIYIPIFLIIVAIFSNVKTIRKYAIIISIFSFIIILAAIWIKKINKIKYKTNLITIKFKIITRNILKTKLRLVEHIFPIYILIHIFTYQIYVYLTNRYFISIRNNVLENSIFLVYYFFLYYLYLKRKILSLDECFYFYITKIERYKSSILKSYFMEISKIISFNIFNIFWGMVIFNKFFTSSNTENNIIFICSQIFISILAISSDIYVYKNKLEVINKPEDLKKYMSFIEGMFLVILLTVVQLIIYSSTEIKSNILIEYLRLDSINLIFNILFGILAVIAIIKSLNFMVINKFNMVRGKK